MKLINEVIYGKDLEAFVEDIEKFQGYQKTLEEQFPDVSDSDIKGVFTIKVEWFSDEQFDPKINKKEAYKPS